MQIANPSSLDAALEFKTWIRGAARSVPLQIAGYGVASAVIYAAAFVRPYGLLDWWMTFNRTIAKFARFEWSAGASYVLGMAALFALYLLTLRAVKARANAWTLAVIVLSALIFNGVLLLLYPVDSADIFDNIIRGRMSALYGLNPFVARPDAVMWDSFFLYAGWKYFPGAYGPLWEELAAIAAWAAGNSIVVNVLVFKLLSVATYAGIGVLVIQMLQEHAPERVGYGAVFWLWNPLVLYTTAGNGHNDAVMLFCVVLAFYLLARQHFTFALMALTAGALVKFIPLLLIPIFLVAAFKHTKESNARLRFLVVTALACGTLAWLSYARFAHDGALVDLDWRWDLYTTSLSTWAWLALQNVLAPKFAALLVSRAGYLLLGAWIAREGIALWRNPRVNSAFDPQPYFRAALSILLFYLLVTAAWFQAWYVAWLIPLAALLPDGFLSRGALVFAAAALWKMPLFDFVLVRDLRPVPSAWWRELWLTLGVLAAPWLYLGVGILKRRENRGWMPRSW